jgi:hypothetical protein
MTKADTAPQSTVDAATARATEALDTNPLGVLAGGLALGAIAGALLPRTDREKDLLRPVGTKIGTAAMAAIAAAKEAGRTELEQRGLTKEAARDQAKSLFQNVAKAATGAATGRSAAQGTAGEADSTGGTGDSVPPADPHKQVMTADTDLGDFRSAI